MIIVGMNRQINAEVRNVVLNGVAYPGIDVGAVVEFVMEFEAEFGERSGRADD